jgi:small subunit ribosomal protein S21
MAGYNLQVKARRNESAESLIKRFSRKIKNSGIIKEVLERRYYEKPSIKRRKEKAKRERVLNKLRQEQNKQ